MAKLSSRDKLLAATKVLLAEKAMDKISVREIAAAAKVNVAAINYYFSTKEVLFGEALDLIVIEGQDIWVQNNLDLNNLKKNDLENYLEFLHSMSIIHQGFAKTRILNMLNADKVNAANLKIFNTIFIIARNLLPATADDNLKVRVTLAFSSLVSLTFSTLEIDQFTGGNISEEDQLRSYIRKITAILFYTGK